ncbi:DinB family protein [Chitinophaga sedimenti]|uniref:DinB family protein n=1 Tax=Chitinophaga sedimenti TaxID=2033606 RepID=UPI0020055B31|nr:DinB family protein [Chitinophaga sedimenti]MCK7559626.1 DinB family protein [Chitinophaga sedimenti]
MKELLRQAAAYNVWANERILRTLTEQPDEVLDLPLPSSFPSLRATVLHMYGAESIWLQRFQMAERAVPPAHEGSFAELADKYNAVSNAIFNFVDKASEARLDHTMEYYNLKKEHTKLLVWKALYQLCNHSTYHRGQLVTLLRAAGVAKIPNTDYIVFPGKK